MQRKRSVSIWALSLVFAWSVMKDVEYLFRYAATSDFEAADTL